MPDHDALESFYDRYDTTFRQSVAWQLLVMSKRYNNPDIVEAIKACAEHLADGKSPLEFAKP